MPFIGKDWRSPGEAWVKTETLGWQRMKIIESQLHPSCHQSHPACSWPPRSEFGQHMAKNCHRHPEERDQSNEHIGRISSAASSCSSSSSSSRGGSVSPSPASSPEKNVHHLYPITVSSPYGQYSACCPHHLESPVGSPKTTPGYYYVSPGNNHDSQMNAQLDKTTSLSRESLPINQVLSTEKGSMQLRYNNSVSDFRNPSSLSSQSRNNEKKLSIETCTSQDQDSNRIYANKYIETESKYNQSNEQSEPTCTPILLNNGCKLDLHDGFKLSSKSSQLDSTGNQSRKPSQQQTSKTSTCCCYSSQCTQSAHHPRESYVRTAPHCRISVRTREVAMYNTISEAFYRLDFCNAIHDIRRFNYICKLLHLLITQNLTSLSGCATKVLFTMLEQVAWEVSSNKRNIHVLKNLLNELRQMIQKYYCWGRPIGSSLLWQQHFDTIERISQIVDEIELSPPKVDTTRATFNSLPVEMIREILLRLNDYRDLVNSAQASPVMRTMIDGQYIWQQLCRYHFTEQQLKLALDAYHELPVKKSCVARGVKYARTASADGRTSFRNPIAHKSAATNNNDSTATATTATRRQLEQTSDRRMSRQKESSPSASYVSRTIKIFDKEGSSMTLGSSRVQRIAERREQKQAALKQQGNSDATTGSSLTNELRSNKEPCFSNTNRVSEIDWERVFHQLRKKFSLKEEYADCLLLCRHCRCLFWKSIGHPCIKNDNDNGQVVLEDRHCSCCRLDRSCTLANGQSNIPQSNSNGSNQAHSDSQRESNEINPGVADRRGSNQRHQSNGCWQSQDRPSVAALSRNFDNRAQRIANAENLAPNESSAPDAGNDNANQQHRSLNENLGAQLRERNIQLAANDNGRRRRQDEAANLPARQAVAIGRSDELVPKHVAISPQAFLKFFSL